jgi:hypothetical protein
MFLGMDPRNLSGGCRPVSRDTSIKDCLSQQALPCSSFLMLRLDRVTRTRDRPEFDKMHECLSGDANAFFPFPLTEKNRAGSIQAEGVRKDISIVHVTKVSYIHLSA